MPTNIIRIRHRSPLPCQEERNQVLCTYFKDDITFHEFSPPEDPGEFLRELAAKAFKLDAVAIEIDTRYRIFTALLGAAWSIGAFNAPVLYPMFQTATPGDGDPATFPVFSKGADDLFVPTADVKFIGYLELVYANVVTKLSEIGG